MKPLFNEIWPLRRRGAHRMTEAELEYRERVGENKRRAAKRAKDEKVSATKAAQTMAREANMRRISDQDRSIKIRTIGLLQSEQRRAKPSAREPRIARNKLRLDVAKAKRSFKRSIATPMWANPAAMRALYSRARELTAATGIEHVVDHIVPLVSNAVCGLNCEINMRVITDDENQRKNNIFWPDMP